MSTLWIALPDGARLRRWLGLAAANGWNAHPTHAHSRAAHGVLLLDSDGAEQAALPQGRGAACVVISSAPLADALIARLLERGVDDCFPETLPDVLLAAKLRSLIRRLAPPATAAGAPLLLPGGRARYQPAKREIETRDDGRWNAALRLTPTEARVLVALHRGGGGAVSRRDLLEGAWADKASEIQPATVDKHIESLRRKLAKFGIAIRSLYGTGYILGDD